MFRLRIYFQAVIICIALMPASAQAKRDKFALLIGSPLVYLNNEKDKDLLAAVPFYDDLTNAVRIDLAKMKTLFINAGYKESDILILADSLLSKASIDHAVDSVLPLLASNAYFVLYFTGHRQQIPDRGVKDEDDKLDETLVLPNEFWVDDDINIMFATKLSGFKNIFIADACYSGSSYQIAKNVSLLQRQLARGSHNFIDD